MTATKITPVARTIVTRTGSPCVLALDNIRYTNVAVKPAVFSMKRVVCHCRNVDDSLKPARVE